MGFHDEELPGSEAPRLLSSSGARRGEPGESVDRTASFGGSWYRLEMTAADMEDRIDQKLNPASPEISEGDLFGVSQQPGRLVVRGGWTLFE